MKVLLMNCYSSKNSGDGLLVDLAIEEIKKENQNDVDITLICSDPESFEDKYNAIGNEYSIKPSKWNVLFLIFKSIIYLITNKYKSKHYDQLGNFDVIYSVGGGYLRFGSILESIKTITVHCTQIFWVLSNFKGKHILLPQSIGPFKFINKFFIKKILNNKSQIYVRDDRSFDELAEIGIDSIREKDMAVNKLIQDLSVIKSSFFKQKKLQQNKVCIFILRDLRRGNDVNLEMLSKVAELSSQFDKVEFAIQSEVNANNDLDFYQNYQIDAKLSVKEALDKYPNAIIISVRLHGAIESLLSGFRTIHLSYERKGFGAYQDLNIPLFVHNVYSFDVLAVKQNIKELSSFEESDFFNLITNE